MTPTRPVPHRFPDRFLLGPVAAPVPGSPLFEEPEPVRPVPERFPQLEQHHNQPPEKGNTMTTPTSDAVAVSDTFAHPCIECGTTVHVVNGQAQPHEHHQFGELDSIAAYAWWQGHAHGTSGTTDRLERAQRRLAALELTLFGTDWTGFDARQVIEAARRDWKAMR